MPEPAFARATRWLTCITIDPAKAGVDRGIRGTRYFIFFAARSSP
ncbi:MAG: hypothetical protein ACYDBT_14210 [Desulfobulbaceae bacterium]